MLPKNIPLKIVEANSVPITKYFNQGFFIKLFLIVESKIIKAKVFEKIFLDLQQDEVELTNDNFRRIFYKLIESYQSDSGVFNLEKFMQSNEMDQNQVITDLVMRDEQYKLHEWEKKKVKKIVEETHNDPKGRTAKIANEFGFELVTIDDTAD